MQPDPVPRRYCHRCRYHPYSPSQLSVVCVVEKCVHTTHRFRPGSFDSFYQWLDTPFGIYHYGAPSANLLNEWQTSADSITK